jgi:hypothetical protein
MDMNLDVIRTLAVDENLQRPYVEYFSPRLPRGSATREGEVGIDEGQPPGLGSKPAATMVTVLGVLLP